MTVVHPIERGWVSTGGTGAQNYDEFASDSEITAIIEANPSSALAIEMPHLAPASLPCGFTEALPDAVARLAEAKRNGGYTPVERVVGLYRITAPGAGSGSRHGAGRAEPESSVQPAYGLFAMVDTDQISTGPDEPGLLIRNEDVFIEKVRERVALARATGHLLSPVLLLQTARGDDLRAALAAVCEGAGTPAVTDLDQAGRTHALWLLGPGPRQDELCALAGGGELVVADGNHRTLAAQLGGLPRFLAVVSSPASVTIQPYNRLISELTNDVPELLARLAAAGAQVERLPGPAAGVPAVPTRSGVVHLYAGPGGSWSVRLPRDPARNMVDNLGHALVERVLLRDALGLDPGDKRITYVGGDYPARWLADEVDAGHAELAVLIAPVTVEDFVTVNLSHQKMPRKSTWFSPKARAGLVLAEAGSSG